MSLLVLLLIVFSASLPVLHLYRSRSQSKRLPPGSPGLPIVGGSLGFLHAVWANRAEEWAGGMVKKYGEISRHSLMGTPTVLLAGQAANKFVFTNDEALVPQQVRPFVRIVGERNLMQLAGEEHRRVRAAVGQFLRLEVLKRCVGRVDEEATHHIKRHWLGRPSVTVLPLAKSFTFDLMCSLIFGIGHGATRDRLLKDFNDMVGGMWSVILGLPFLNFNKSLRARRRIRGTLSRIVNERRDALTQGKCSSSEDLISYLVDLGCKADSEVALTDEEILDNMMLVFVAGYDTSSSLITLMIRQLATDPVTRAEVIREVQEEIANGKASIDDPLIWDDILKMKYTWRFTMETLRMIPPVFGSMRKVLKDVEYNGYLIPKGWHVLWVTNVTQMDPNIFSDPTTFDPTRFENQSSVPPYCFVPFGGGRRLCPGNEFVRLEILVIMYHLVRRFEWDLLREDEVLRRYPLPSLSSGLPILLRPKSSISNAIS